MFNGSFVYADSIYINNSNNHLHRELLASSGFSDVFEASHWQCLSSHFLNGNFASMYSRDRLNHLVGITGIYILQFPIQICPLYSVHNRHMITVWLIPVLAAVCFPQLVLAKGAFYCLRKSKCYFIHSYSGDWGLLKALRCIFDSQTWDFPHLLTILANKMES